ncbi:MAG TPA: XRE family transcriptional regulator [Candidatus Acidoferrum sp.]
MPHYTSANDETMFDRITFDFVAQLSNRLETAKMEQRELARKLKVSESAVSQVLNLNRTNLNLRTMVRYARALGMKVAVVAYDDHDPQNEYGPVGSEIFSLAWEKIGRPRDVWSVNEATSSTNQCLYTLHDWRYGWMNSTFSGLSSTIGELPHYAQIPNTQPGTTAHA